MNKIKRAWKVTELILTGLSIYSEPLCLYVSYLYCVFLAESQNSVLGA